ncbi:hypothetical protein HanRHA438_Chr14g0661271 [Helianthus annuus]|nr:hypothetical protein HanIR_Chr14g0705691 [Helianthus annuus]KAJ0854316.1 hypothetical protein HanRHA438_Chr14g0661271 [Helianthus annuus]
MSVRPMRAAEEYWAEKIRPNFMHARDDLFVAPLVATEGVLRNLGINHEEKKPKRVSKKKVTVAEGMAIKKQRLPVQRLMLRFAAVLFAFDKVA